MHGLDLVFAAVIVSTEWDEGGCLYGVQDSEHFCRSTLCNPEVSQWLDSMLVCWGGNIRYHSAFDVSESTAGPTPCCAIRSQPQDALLMMHKPHSASESVL